MRNSYIHNKLNFRRSQMQRSWILLKLSSNALKTTSLNWTFLLIAWGSGLHGWKKPRLKERKVQQQQLPSLRVNEAMVLLVDLVAEEIGHLLFILPKPLNFLMPIPLLAAGILLHYPSIAQLRDIQDHMITLARVAMKATQVLVLLMQQLMVVPTVKALLQFLNNTIHFLWRMQAVLLSVQVVHMGDRPIMVHMTMELLHHLLRIRLHHTHSREECGNKMTSDSFSKIRFRAFIIDIPFPHWSEKMQIPVSLFYFAWKRMVDLISFVNLLPQALNFHVLVFSMVVVCLEYLCILSIWHCMKEGQWYTLEEWLFSPIRTTHPFHTSANKTF